MKSLFHRSQWWPIRKENKYSHGRITIPQELSEIFLLFKKNHSKSCYYLKILYVLGKCFRRGVIGLVNRLRSRKARYYLVENIDYKWARSLTALNASHRKTYQQTTCEEGNPDKYDITADSKTVSLIDRFIANGAICVKRRLEETGSRLKVAGGK